MTLLVDLGNSRIKWASSHGKTIKFPGSKRHAGRDLSPVLDLVWGKKETPNKVLVANVAGGENRELLRIWIEKNWHFSPIFVESVEEQAGVKNHYVEPALLGVDRWMAMIAAHRKAKHSCCVVDCGTAITIDVVNQSGDHMGGLIVPGVETMRRSLMEGTASIRDIKSVSAGPTLLARDTQGAVIGGTLYTVIATIDRAMLDITSQIAGRMSYYLTGGDAKLLLPLLHEKFSYEQDLVLHGLNIASGEMP